VALVAIVYLVGNATSTIRESRQLVTPSPTAPASLPSEPTRATAEPPAAPAQDVRFKLTGITKDPGDGKYLAIINGQLRAESQYVDGATIKKIERDRVTIELNGREQVLRLF
jgi:type II secretory pathway component PulC